MNSILSFNKLSIGYSKPIATGLSADLAEGEILQISGSNGSGKTTLVKTLLGEIDAIDGDIKRNFSNAYYLSQSYDDYIHLPITVAEILNHDTSEIDFDSSLKWNELSGGQKQQVLIIRAFSQKVDLLILDEPLNHLDQGFVGKVKDLIERKLAANPKLSVILISHLPLEFKSKTIQVSL